MKFNPCIAASYGCDHDLLSLPSWWFLQHTAKSQHLVKLMEANVTKHSSPCQVHYKLGGSKVCMHTRKPCSLTMIIQIYPLGGCHYPTIEAALLSMIVSVTLVLYGLVSSNFIKIFPYTWSFDCPRGWVR